MIDNSSSAVVSTISRRPAVDPTNGDRETFRARPSTSSRTMRIQDDGGWSGGGGQFIVGSTYDSDLKNAKISFRNIVSYFANTVSDDLTALQVNRT